MRIVVVADFTTLIGGGLEHPNRLSSEFNITPTSKSKSIFYSSFGHVLHFEWGIERDHHDDRCVRVLEIGQSI